MKLKSSFYWQFSYTKNRERNMHVATAGKFCQRDKKFLRDVSRFWYSSLSFFKFFFFFFIFFFAWPSARSRYKNSTFPHLPPVLAPNLWFPWQEPSITLGMWGHCLCPGIKRKACITRACCTSHPLWIHSEIAYLWKIRSGNMNMISRATWPTFW